MKTWSFCVSAVVSAGLVVFGVGSVSAQYLPPMLNGAVPYRLSVESLSGQSSRQDRSERGIYRENQKIPETQVLAKADQEDETRLDVVASDSSAVVPAQDVNILITPIAGPASSTIRTPEFKERIRPMQDGVGNVPQDSNAQPGSPEMVPLTVYYFPPPTFPDPVPLTVHRPVVSQGGVDRVAGAGEPMLERNAQNLLYAPPMVVQPHYFGPGPLPQQQSYCERPGGGGGVGRLANKLKEKRIRKQRALADPGEPIVGPPTLVYPNGIVVRPKVFLPDQPCKNVIRALTP